MTAFQRFLDGLFGNKEKAAPEGMEKEEPEGTGQLLRKKNRKRHIPRPIWMRR